MNGVPETQTEESLKEPQFRILIVNNKFQTGFDEPMLHTMYVDKKFGGLQCVQTLSRLNRTMKGKTDTFVLDFVNDPQDVQESFQPYYEGTILEEETDPNKLYSIKDDIDEFHLFNEGDISNYVDTFYKEEIPTEELQGILDSVVVNWKSLEEDEQEEFRGHIYSFIRLYGYISQVITFKDIDLEKLFIFVRGLSKKLPRREGGKLSDILSSIDLEYFKIEKKFTSTIELDDGDTVIEPIGSDGSGGMDDEPTDFLSHIIEILNDSFDGEFSDEDKVKFEKIKRQVHENEELRMVMTGDNSDSNKRDKFDRTFQSLVTSLVENNLDFYKKLSESKRNKFIKDRLYEDYTKSLEVR
jgi:type I restriction enzyme R subunit